MSIRVALHHQTAYRYDRPTRLEPQVVRLRPAPHCRTPISSYALRVRPERHFASWQQDPHGNHLARLVFPEPVTEFVLDVDLVVDLSIANPFDFFLEESVQTFPFRYEEGLAWELRPYLEPLDETPLVRGFVTSLESGPATPTIDFLVALNQKLCHEVRYVIRAEPGVQDPEETLRLGSGSCRDSSWLLVQILRRLGLAARFVSGYLIQLAPDQRPIDGPPGPESDFTDLHAWAEAYLPGGGWVGLDPTSGLLTGEGHLPLACSPTPEGAAPISGLVENLAVDFSFSMDLRRIEEAPASGRPYSDGQWASIDAMGRRIDERLRTRDVRLSMGGEPTFVSIDDMDGAEWNTAAVGPEKRRLAEVLIKRLRRRLAPGGLLHYGQGKWYAGETLPRWALACVWRRDGESIWDDPDLIADTDGEYDFGHEEASEFADRLAWHLPVDARFLLPAYEDAAYYLWREHRLPLNVRVTDSKLGDPEERARLARVFDRGVHVPVGFVLPLQRQWWQHRPRWQSGPWPLRAGKLFVVPGDSPIGLRLPMDGLPWLPPSRIVRPTPVDPMAPRPPLPQRRPTPHEETEAEAPVPPRAALDSASGAPPDDTIRTALCIEPRNGRLHVFLPPLDRIEDYLDLVGAVEATARKLQMPVVIEGYLPPPDPRLHQLKVTPDPGVIEVNVHPAERWEELVENTEVLYEEARGARLGTEKFDLDGRHSGTGGGNHVALGATLPEDSPFLRRPDLLKSLIGYWQNHPSLSYLFSGKFVGPTSQAPRVDEGRKDALYELDLAFSQVPPRGQDCPPWMVDRVFRNLLTDLTGNTHRAEFCIDKLFSPDSSTGRLGLLELRGFEMPPHPRMSLTQQLLIRALVALFWDAPYSERLIDWGTALHDRFLLPYFAWRDFGSVLDDLRQAGFAFEADWFRPHFELRFPPIGKFVHDDVVVELRTAIEPWYVLGEEPAGGGTVRFVDSSVERLQVHARGLVDSRHAVLCNGRRVPMRETGVPGEFVAGVRYRAWAPPSCLHPTIPVHTPLLFDLLDVRAGRALAGCQFHVAHPGGRTYDSAPVNANEAEARRAARFTVNAHTAGSLVLPPEEWNPAFPLTLDLRRPTRTV